MFLNVGEKPVVTCVLVCVTLRKITNFDPDPCDGLQ